MGISLLSFDYIVLSEFLEMGCVLCEFSGRGLCLLDWISWHGFCLLCAVAVIKGDHHHKCAQLCHLLHFPEMLQKMLIRQENNVSYFCSFVDAGSCSTFCKENVSCFCSIWRDVGSWCPLPVVPFASSSVNILANINLIVTANSLQLLNFVRQQSPLFCNGIDFFKEFHYHAPFHHHPDHNQYSKITCFSRSRKRHGPITDHGSVTLDLQGVSFCCLVFQIILLLGTCDLKRKG